MKAQWQVSFVANPSARGAITVNGQPSGTAWYDDSAVVRIQATANAVYAFSVQQILQWLVLFHSVDVA
jgi:hypothetical protein